ncbi:MAG: S-methyl-5'-thioadenosine phosphorylase [bacterium]|nr:S-methyl-5'-thioadenosine phosphorylase [bacterium]
MNQINNQLPKAEIGIFGGSGFYSFFDKGVKEVEMRTPYGFPSDKITIGKVAGHTVAFLPRHGKKHQFAPHSIPYRANLWAFKQLGIKRILGPSAAGSLQARIKPGDFVICDQFIDQTKHREETFYPGPKIAHISCAEPYCPQLRRLAIDCCKELVISHHEKGDVVVIEGPRFTSRAESYWYQKSGFEVINMTQYPEVVLARELEMCYVNISLITDYDAGLIGKKNIKPVEAAAVIKIFNNNLDKVKELIVEMIKKMPRERKCSCGSALAGSGV